VGKWSEAVCVALPYATLLAVEPVPAAFSQLTARLAHLPTVRCDNRAVADTEGEATLHVARDSTFSSLLPSARGLADLYGDKARTANTITVPVTTLDRLVAGAQVSLLKLDVQGAELRVIAGGEKTLANTQAVLVESNVAEQYEDASDLGTVYSALTQRGFTLWDLTPPDRSSEGRPLWLDAMYVRLLPGGYR
jgi:FkbM family methyltransferase